MPRYYALLSTLGASRHHFGTDLDIYDTRPIDDDYQLQLTPDEYSFTGPFAKLVAWLDDNLEKHGLSPFKEQKVGLLLSLGISVILVYLQR